MIATSRVGDADPVHSRRDATSDSDGIYIAPLQIDD